MKAAILRNEEVNSSKKWEAACEKAGLEYEVIDLSASDWLKNVKSSDADFFLLRPSDKTERFKTLYDERIYIINEVLKLPVYPLLHEVQVYENKKYLSYFLEANEIPHPETTVFYSKQEALDSIPSITMPIVGKTSIGASGAGVKVIKTHAELKKYIKRAFSSKGLKRKFGPNRAVGTPSSWAKKAKKKPGLVIEKLKKYRKVFAERQRHYMILQEFIPHEFEWRAVRIGDSYFAHKKTIYKGKASGSKGIDYVQPPESLLNFVKDLCEKFDYHFMAIDLFEGKNGEYLVNEMQTLFGHVQDFICEVDGKVGRYIMKEGKWVFEEGDFNTNESYDLRLQTAIDLFNKRK